MKSEEYANLERVGANHWYDSGNRDEQRSEDRIPSPPVNAILRRVFVGMAMWREPFPFGVSLVLVARRR